MNKLRLSVDDGCASDMRLADLAKKYEVETIFYWPVEWQTLGYQRGYEPLSYYQARQISQNFEIGSHTITHRLLTRIPVKEARDEIGYSKLMLEGLFDKPVTRFCPPRGYTNELLTEFTLDIYFSQRLTVGDGLVHIHPKSGVNDGMHWLDYVRDNEVTEIWCHGWELDLYPEEWINLERYLSEVTHT